MAEERMSRVDGSKGGTGVHEWLAGQWIESCLE
jgi:hypothetical protein